MKAKFIFCCLGVFLLFSCGEEKKPTNKTAKKQTKKPSVQAPNFNADSAYHFIEKQVNFGPRVPNSDAHKKCASWLEKTLIDFGLKVIIQEAEVTAFNGSTLEIKNIIAQHAPEKKARVMLFAHWDTRPFADRDSKNRGLPIDGANDGASGVGVLLEIGRLLSEYKTKPNVGVDIIFFDAEDFGQPNGGMMMQQGNTWCLGTQYWAKNPPIEPYRPMYGILLDMVGAKNAIFPQEGTSVKYAAHVLKKVWGAAKKLGYSHLFTNAFVPGGITDDHLYVNTIAHIPSIDIIHYEVPRSDFGSFHHTHQDNMDLISKETLKAVGQTVLEVVYSEG